MKALDANKYRPHKSNTVSQLEHIAMCNYHMESVKTMSHTHMKQSITELTMLPTSFNNSPRIIINIV